MQLLCEESEKVLPAEPARLVVLKALLRFDPRSDGRWADMTLGLWCI
jgi:hypothetical protein